ncbi:MAG TPA: regulatory protein RecX [Candidatus Saccharimonadales bacterium]|nr:regulatory protein RecX [Candidatus Saccharimonadales bacterium]
MKNQDPKYVFEKAYNRVLNFVAYQQRSEHEVIGRINRYLSKVTSLSIDQKQEVKDKILAEFKDQKLINDDNFAKMYVSQKMQSPKPASKLIIERFLYKKGIPKDIIKEATSVISSENEFDEAMKAADKKFRNLKLNDLRKAKQKLTAYLFSKGFQPSTVYSVVDTKFKVQ